MASHPKSWSWRKETSRIQRDDLIMPKERSSRKYLDSFTIKGTNKPLCVTRVEKKGKIEIKQAIVTFGNCGLQILIEQREDESLKSPIRHKRGPFPRVNVLNKILVNRRQWKSRIGTWRLRRGQDPERERAPWRDFIVGSMCTIRVFIGGGKDC
ncbi:unnamed protein product [Sphenostylis stenocarpa]|uniref:Uncharacterized protein n=1 Tax=Sphenostylis stenocarpa TaxID=92480 RepID=A0AA86SSC8_9FABA|nr:unnamed protein product [Sphenostylis stenocarpa]